MATADRLLELMYSWMEQRENCAEKLKDLARELESLREKCNISECAGSSVSVVGAACLLGAGAATLFTGGAAAPLLGVIGAVYSGVGATISVVTKITEHFLSSNTMKEALEVDKKSSKIGEKMQQLFEQLKAEKRKLSPHADPDELDQHVMAEFLTAMGKRSGLKGKIVVRTVHNETRFFLDAGPDYQHLGFDSNQLWHFGAGSGPMMANFTPELTFLVAGTLAIFAMKAGGKNSKVLFAKGTEQVIKQMSAAALKTTLKGGAMVAGGTVGMVFSLPEAIDNWTDLIKKNHETEASKSMRETANNILESTRTLKKQFDNIKREFKEMAERLRHLEAERRRQLEAERRRENKEKCFREKRESAEPEAFSITVRVKDGPVLSTFSLHYLWKSVKEPSDAERINRPKSKPSQRREDDQEREQSRQNREAQRDGSRQSGGGQQGGGHQGGGGDQGDEDTESEDEKSDQQSEESESEEESENDESRTRSAETQLEINQNRRVNFGLLNVRSLRNVTLRVHELITRGNISVFLTTETWLKADNALRLLGDASPENFTYFYFTRPSRGGGVAIQSAEELQGGRVQFNHDPCTFEVVAANLQHAHWDEPVLIINLYHPRGGMMRFLNDLKQILNEIIKKYKNIIVAGDFNIWVDDAKRAKKFLQFLKDNNLEQHIREPTHRGNHILDLVLTRNVEISNIDIQNHQISDHFTVSFKARPKKTKEKKDEDENKKRYKKREE